MGKVELSIRFMNILNGINLTRTAATTFVTLLGGGKIKAESIGYLMNEWDNIIQYGDSLCRDYEGFLLRLKQMMLPKYQFKDGV